MNDNDIRPDAPHGIDGDPNHDASKGAKLGGVGGAVTGLIAGAAAGPAGALVGAVIGGVAGAIGSGAAVAAVDAVDNDNTITGIGDDNVYRDHHTKTYSTSGRTYEGDKHAYTYGEGLASNPRYTNDYSSYENDVRSDYETQYPNSKYDDVRDAVHTGYHNSKNSASRAVGDVTGTGTSEVRAGTNAEVAMGGNGVPGIQTGGTSYDGTTPDTRGITEKIADKITGDHTDDKTGKAV